MKPSRVWAATLLVCALGSVVLGQQVQPRDPPGGSPPNYDRPDKTADPRAQAMLAKHRERLERLKTLKPPMHSSQRRAVAREAWRLQGSEAVAAAVAGWLGTVAEHVVRPPSNADPATPPRTVPARVPRLEVPELVEWTDTSTPWLWPRLQGVQVWRVPFTLVGAGRGDTGTQAGAQPWSDIRNSGRGVAIVDPVDGSLVCVQLDNLVQAGQPVAEPPAADMEAHLWAGFEAWVGYPTAPTKMTLMDALEAIAGEWGVVDAKRIVAYCVLVSKEGEPPHAVWSVHRLGTLRSGAIGPVAFQVQEATRHERHMFNADTGASEGSETWGMKHWQQEMQERAEAFRTRAEAVRSSGR